MVPESQNLEKLPVAERIQLIKDQCDEQMRQWVTGWQAAGRVLDNLRTEAIRQANTAESIELLSDAFESTLLHRTPSLTSGLVEQQRLFARWRP
jgi:hypothetical protein